MEKVRVDRLQTTFETKLGPVRAVDGVSYTIKKGQTLGIVGESGCGKSVTSFSLMGLIEHPGKVTGGAFYLDGDNVFEMTERQRQDLRGGRMAMVFQEPMTALNPVHTIGYQIEEQLARHTQLSKNDRRLRSIELLELVGIPAAKSRVRAYPHELSGGMRQRAMIAMALSCDPEFLIADEPTTALDVTIQAQILALMQDLRERLGMTMQFITHDLGVIYELADDVMVMYAGRTCESGRTEDIFSQPLHPYTHALLQSIPRLGRAAKRLPTIDGSVPSLHALPEGCAFQNRCPFAQERCRTERPELKATGSGQHSVACHYPVNL